jgi:hypothetical protein
MCGTSLKSTSAASGRRPITAFCTATAMTFGLAFGPVTVGHAEGPGALPAGVVPPPMSFARAQYFKSHPEAWAAFVAGLPRQTPDTSEQSRTAGKPGASGPWQKVADAPTNGLCAPLLLTDGTVMVHSCSTPVWYKLSPDAKGNYADGTWSTLAPLPVIGGTQYAPQYDASAVLPDGRVIVMGGEYNNGQAVWTNLGAIYDPVANAWTAVTAPSGWTQIGDAESVVLASGSFMLASCCANPDADAILNPTNLTWTSTGAPNAGLDYQDEQGYELLPNGNVLTLDIWTNYNKQGNAKNAEQYSPLTAVWTSAGNTPVSLVDPYACGNFEIGPAVTRGDGTVVAFGGNTGCQAPTADPTAIFNVKKSKWTAGPDVPATCGSGGTTSCSLPDSPAALEPDGAILFAASANYGGQPTHFFEFSATNAITQVADTVLHSANSGAYYYNFLVLPNGQILETDFSKNAEVYTPSGAPVAAWAPMIKKVPAKLVPGASYTVTGMQLNGVSQGAYYGDDYQSATNYPIVKIVNKATGDVAYARSVNFSSMSVKPMNKDDSADFTLPAGIETGKSSLYVVANGIASTPVDVTVK